MSNDESYRELAVAVIVAAVRDFREGRGRAQLTAQHFLRGSQEYFFWAAVAEVDGESLR